MSTPPTSAASALTAPAGLGRSLRRGEHLLWLSGSALALAFLLIAGLLVLVVSSGATFFWHGGGRETKTRAKRTARTRIGGSEEVRGRRR